MERRLKILLVVSLVLNLFLIGAAAGAVMVRMRLAQIAPPPRGAALMRGLQALGPEDRAAFRRAMRARAVRLDPVLREARAARARAVDEFAQPTFDPAAARDALARARDAEGRARAQVEDGVVEFAAGLPADKRQALGQALRRGPLGRGGGAGPGPGGGPPPDRR